LEPIATANRKEPGVVKCTIRSILCLFLLGFTLLGQAAKAQVKVGDDVTMRMSGLLTGGYSGSYGDQISSSHSLDFGADAQITGDYYSPNFLNFSILPYYNRSAANSALQSLTNSSGVDASANLFSGGRFPGFVNYHYAKDSTGNFGAVGAPNFTTIGTSQGFGIGWSALIPDKPTLSVSYAQGSGNGTLFGTNDESASSTKTFSARSSYNYAGWNLGAFYTYTNIHSNYPEFLSGVQGDNLSHSDGNDFGVSGSHKLPWNGSAALNFTHFSYSNDYNANLTSTDNHTNYSMNQETANFTFRPTAKLGLFFTQNFDSDLNGLLYQNLLSNGGGLPIIQTSTQSFSSTLAGGASYAITPNLYSTAQLTYYNQAYLGKTYQGSYFSGTLGYSKRFLRTFNFSGTVIESSNKFSNNSLGFIGNVNAFHNFGPWQFSGNFSYAQNVQTILVTYTNSYYNYGANLHRRLSSSMQWTVSANGSHSGFNNQSDSSTHSESFSTSLALRHLTFAATYGQSTGQSLLTSTGIQPIPPTPGLPSGDLIVYNGKSYGGSIGITPIRRLTITGSYSHAVSDTLASDIFSRNRTEIFYSQMQYRLRRINLLAGYTKFSQGISAAGTPPGNQYSFFIGVSRWLNFF
jgi:hypothetical protein